MKTKTSCFIFSVLKGSNLVRGLVSIFFPSGDVRLKQAVRFAAFSRYLILTLLLVIGPGASAQQANSITRDEAIELMARVSFESREKAIRQKQKNFENATGLKVQFRVEDASLDKLGGLAEHLFRLFQSFTSSQNNNARTITGEFSLLENGELRDFMSYRTKPTADLSACRLPAPDTDSLDERYSRWLAGDLSASAQNINEVPASMDEFYPQAIGHYESILYKNRNCPSDPNSQNYDLHAGNTVSARALKWSNDVQRISANLNLNFQGIINNGLAPGSHYGHFINLNNSVNECTARDLESSCRILYKKAGIHFFFVTHTLDYFIPEDSLEVFTQQAVASFSNNVSDNLIIGLYLNMRDPDRGTSCPLVLVSQKNGTWLSRADIDFANHNNLGSYQGTAVYKFRNLIRNIPKPLILCYQVAKINGLLSTVYIEKAQHVKGREQIYNHVFQCDKAFDELVEMNLELDAINASRENGRLDPYSNQRYAELTAKIRLTRLRALREPDLRHVAMFKEAYLENKDLAQASALDFLKKKYGDVFKNNQIDALLATYPPPTDIEAGSCPGGDESDLIADALGLASLLLSPTGLDIVPDALSVLYFTETGQDLDAVIAMGSVAMPANTWFIRKTANDLSDAIHGIRAGEVLAKESGSLKLVSQDANQVMTLFRLDPALAGSGLIQKIEDRPLPAGELLSTDPNKSRVFTNVVEHLEEPKRREFVNKFLDDADFRNKVINDPDEVLRWGGVVRTRIDDWVEEIEKEILFPDIASTFQDGLYRTVITKSSITLYRAFGDRAKLFGGFATTISNETRNKLALLDEWNNNMAFEVAIKIPKGTSLNLGKVARQISSDGNQILEGGADQILLPKDWNAFSWIDKIIEKETGKEYTLSEFQNLFPKLVN